MIMQARACGPIDFGGDDRCSARSGGAGDRGEPDSVVTTSPKANRSDNWVRTPSKNYVAASATRKRRRGVQINVIVKSALTTSAAAR